MKELSNQCFDYIFWSINIKVKYVRITFNTLLKCTADIIGEVSDIHVSSFSSHSLLKLSALPNPGGGHLHS